MWAGAFDGGLASHKGGGMRTELGRGGRRHKPRHLPRISGVSRAVPHTVGGRGTVPSVSDTSDATGANPALGKISLGQKKVSEDEFDRHGDAAIRRRDPKEVGRLNRLVPYLDLFERLEDRELARLANVPERTVLRMRDQVKSVRRKLHPYVGLLDRLDDLQLARIAETSPKMFQYLRLCQPRGPNVKLKRTSKVPAFVSISNERTEAEEQAAAAVEESPVGEAAQALETKASITSPPPADAGGTPLEGEFEFSFTDDDDW